MNHHSTERQPGNAQPGSEQYTSRKEKQSAERWSHCLIKNGPPMVVRLLAENNEATGDQSTDGKIEHVARSEQADKSKTRHLGTTSARESTTGRLAHEQSPDDEALRQGKNRDRKPKSEVAKTETGRRRNPEPTSVSPRERTQKIQSSLLGHRSDGLSEGKTSWCARAEPGRRR
jgi:hypothetical protein